MKASELRGKEEKELQEQLVELRKEEFNLRMQSAMAQMPRTHQFKLLRKDIARIKTVINEKNTKAKAD